MAGFESRTLESKRDAGAQDAKTGVPSLAEADKAAGREPFTAEEAELVLGACGDEDVEILV